MAFFEKKKQPSTDQNLKDSFKHAVYGDFCRTRSLVNTLEKTGDHKEWMETYYWPGQGWCLKKMEYGIHHTDSKNKTPTFAPSIKQTPLYEKDKLNFFEAIEKLALYETQQPDFMEPAQDNEIQELDKNHFKSFAEREGIAFDTTGMPQATINGHVPGKGNFQPEAFEKAKDAHRRKQERLTAPLSEHLPPISTADFIVHQNMIESIGTIRDHLKRIRNDVIKNGTTDPLFYKSALTNKTFKNFKNEYKYIYQSAELLFGDKMVADDLKPDKSTHNIIYRPVALFKFILCMRLAASARFFMQRRKVPEGCNVENINLFESKAQSTLKTMGYQDNIDEFIFLTRQNYLHHFEQKESAKIDKGLDMVIDYLEKAKTYFENRIGVETAREIKTLPEPQALIFTNYP